MRFTISTNSQLAVPGPLQKLRRQSLIVWLVAVPMVVVLGWWAMFPLDAASVSLVILESVTEPSTLNGQPPVVPSSVPPIDPRMFAVKLWNPPVIAETPGDSASAANSPPPASVKLQLIGIIRESLQPDNATAPVVYRAALYDADQDRLMIVEDGERIGDLTVRIVAGRCVELSDGGAVRRLWLRPDKESPS